MKICYTVIMLALLCMFAAFVFCGGCTVKFKASEVEYDGEAVKVFELDELCLFEPPGVYDHKTCRHYKFDSIGFKNGQSYFARSADKTHIGK